MPTSTSSLIADQLGAAARKGYLTGGAIQALLDNRYQDAADLIDQLAESSREADDNAYAGADAEAETIVL